MGMICPQQKFRLSFCAFVKIWTYRRAAFAHILLICPEIKYEGISSSLWILFHFEDWCFFVLIYVVKRPLNGYKPFFMRSSLIHLALCRPLQVDQACCFISDITWPCPEWFLLVQVFSHYASNFHSLKHTLKCIFWCVINKVFLFQLSLTQFLRASVNGRGIAQNFGRFFWNFWSLCRQWFKISHTCKWFPSHTYVFTDSHPSQFF